MAGLGFHDAGYEYLDKGSYVLFSENNAHNMLFDYVAANISPVSGLLERHVLMQMNLDTFELTPRQQNGDVLSEIKAILVAAHPYYQYEMGKTIIRAIGEYFNQLLVYSIYRCQNSALGQEVTESWYKERLFALIPAPLCQETDDIGPDDFFAEYKKQTAEWNVIRREGTQETVESAEAGETEETWEMDETFVFNVPKEKPTPFSSEINTQKEIANILYFVLDVDADHLNKLPIQQRVWIYANIFRASNPPTLNVTDKVSLYQQPRFYSGVDRSQEIEKAQNLEEIFSPLYPLGEIDLERNGIPASLQEQLVSAVEFGGKITSSALYEIYEIENLRQLLFLEVLRMIQSKEMIRKCKNCGKYFKIKNRKIVYCDRVIESGRMCSEVGAIRSYQKKMADDETLKLYNRAYKTHFARRKNGILSQNGFQEWCIAAKDKLDKARCGDLNINEFRDWLKK